MHSLERPDGYHGPLLVQTMGRDSGGPQPFPTSKKAFPMRKKVTPSHELIRLDGRTYVFT